MTQAPLDEERKGRADKALIGLLLLVPVLMLGMSVFGWSKGELMGWVGFGLLPASIVTIGAVALSVAKSSSAFGLARATWLMMSLLTLLVSVVAASQPHVDSVAGAETLLAYSMLILSFPCGFVVPFFLMGITTAWPGWGGVGGLVGTGLCFATVGYLQWFHLAPSGLRKCRARRKGVNAG
jgi:hypothetical protein